MTQGLIELNWSSLMILANVIILYFIMKRFFFEKIHNFMQARKDAVTDAIATAEDTNRKADKKMEDYQRKIARIEEDGRDIIRKSKARAEDEAKRIIEEANNRAENIIVKAEKEMERERVETMNNVRSEIGSLALLAASKVMERELEDNDAHRQLVDKVIEEAGNSGWQN